MLPPAIRLTGDAGREEGREGGRDLGIGAINGLVVSYEAVDVFAFVVAPGRVARLAGVAARETLLIADTSDGVRGVLASERARCLDGVLGLLNIMIMGESELDVHLENNAFSTLVR